MFDRKKTAAFIAGLLICASTAAAPLSAHAVEGWGIPDISEQTTAAPDYEKSGVFSYSVTRDNTVCIEDCSSTEESLTIPDTLEGMKVTELGRTALGSDPDSNTFTSVEIPASIEYISADNLFMYCTKLREVKVAEGNANYCAEDGVLYTKDKSELLCYPMCKEGSSFTVPDGVKKIGNAAFYDTALGDVKLSADVEELGYFAFGSLKGMKSLDLSGTSIHTLGSYAFSGCDNLGEIILPDTLEAIGGGAFAGCKNLTDITIPDSVTSIGQFAFADTGLDHILVPETVEEIGYSAFGYYTDPSGEMKAKTDFTIIGTPNSAAHRYSVDSDTDYNYQNSFDFLTPSQYEEQRALLALDRKEDGDFEYAEVSGCAVLTLCKSQEKSIKIPDTLGGIKVIKIYPAAFTNTQAETIELPDTVEELREMSFYSCPELVRIKIPASVKIIGNNAFDNCQKLEEIEFEGAETIGSSVFCNCSALKKVTAAGCLQEWKGDEPFVYCTSLEEINITEGDGNYMSENGILYTKDGKKLIGYPAAKTDREYTARAGLEEICQSAFIKAVSLEKADLTGVKKIGAYAFEDCEKLSEVIFTEGLESVDSDAFYGCTSLLSVRLPESLKNIGDGAFGFYHNDSADTANGEDPNTLVEGFRIYARKNSEGYQYAKANGIEVISGTAKVFGKNMDVRFLAVLGGLIAAAVLALTGRAIGKNVKKKKAEKQKAEHKAEAAERRKKRLEQEAAAEENEDPQEEEADED
ncbi:MAG: leucine-rich repeat protein [Ruminococcus sp.]|nr:leucine-rich repeat protein [Ruminococcus sp.]